MRILVGFATGLTGLALASGACAAPTNSFVITHVRVFDGDRVIPDATVIVRDGRVFALGHVRAPADLATIDGAGKTLLPGLIDAHTHTFGSARRDALRFGVTTELDMFTAPTIFSGLAAARGSLAQTQESDLFSAGVLATAPHGHGTEYGFSIPTITAPGDADSWVRARIAEGSDYIKIVYEPGRPGMPSIDAPTLAAVVKAAHTNGKLAVVHISTVDGARTAIEAGADGLMHAFSDRPADPGFYRLAAAHRIFVAPTLAVISGISGGDDGVKLAADPDIAPYLSGEQVAALNARPRAPGYHPEVAAGEVAELKGAHLDILAGTDAGNPTTAHGASLHEEMALLVQAGLTPLEALRGATSVPARRFGLKDRGRIVAGARADLVLVDGNPTQDIRLSRRIGGIWKNGYPVDRAPPKFDASPAMSSGGLGDFEVGLDGPPGTVWLATSDRLAGGESVATVSRATPGAGGSRGALHVTGSVKPGRFAWGGAQLQFGPLTGPGRDLSSATSLVFRVRGDRPGAIVMLFAAGNPAPMMRPVTVGAVWREVRVPLSSFPAASLKSVVGLAVTTDTTPGAFSYDLDDIRLE